MELNATLSTKTSIYETQKLSLGLVLFKSLKSMQTLIFPSFFGTITMLPIVDI
jgi:hypothetical protein